MPEREGESKINHRKIIEKSKINHRKIYRKIKDKL